MLEGIDVSDVQGFVNNLTENIDIAHCVHCGRIYLLNEKMGDECICGAELYPVRRKLKLGELKLSDGHIARVEGIKND